MTQATKSADADQLRAAGVMYVANGRVLLIKRRKDAPHGGTWSFPAGGIEEGESAVAAAVRESSEEISFTPDGELPLIDSAEGFALFRHECEQFTPLLNDESDGYVWADLDDLPSPLHPRVGDQIEIGMRQSPALDAAAMDDSARQFDINGWYEVKNNPLSKVGVFPYLGRQLPGAPDQNAIYQVYRPAEELADPECIASFRLLPWVDEHVMLGSEEQGLTPAEQKGVHGVIGEEVYFDPDAFEAGGLLGNIKAFSQSLAGLIEAGKRELSCGYRCQYEWKSGVFNGQPYEVIQRRIRGNHLALVESGRMGPEVSVLDGSALDHMTFSFNAKEIDMAEDNKGAGAASVSLDQADIVSLKALATAAPALLKLAGTGKDESDPEKDDPEKKGATDEDPDADPDKKDEDKKGAADADPDDKDEDKKAEGMDAAIKAAVNAALKTRPQITFKDVMAQVTRRDALANQLSAHIGTFDHAEMTESEVAAYGVKKLGLSVPAGQEVTALSVYMAAKPAPSPSSAIAQDTSGHGEGVVNRYLNKEA